MARPLSGSGWVGRAQRGRSESRARRHGHPHRHRPRLHAGRRAGGSGGRINGRRAAIGSGGRVRRRHARATRWPEASSRGTDAGETIVRGAQCTDAVAVLPAASASGEIATLSRVVSFDDDGFTLETTHLASELPLAVLALEGGDYAVGLGAASSRVYESRLRAGRSTRLRHRAHRGVAFARLRTPVRRRLLARSAGGLHLVVLPRLGRSAPLALHQRSRLRGHRHDIGRAACPRDALCHRTASLLARVGPRIALQETSASSRSARSFVRLRWAIGYACWAAAARSANSASSTRTATGVAASGSATL